jgi:N-acetylhexosamine 1-kinase
VNESWLADDAGRRFVVQRLSHRAFRDPATAVRNFVTVSHNLRSRDVCTVRVRATRAGDSWFVDDAGDVWRAYHYVDGRVARPRSPRAVHDVAFAFGAFARALARIDDAFTPAIARFHNFGHRVRQFEQAVARDRVGRARATARDIDRLGALIDAVRAVDEFSQWARQPPRVVHNDAKPANLILTPGRPCVIDLDTVAGGRLGTDVGEIVRSVLPEASHAPADLDTVAAVWRGFVRGWRHELAPAERAILPIAGVVLATELASRYLTDHLDGDRYFALDPATTSLDRARVQVRRATAQLAVLDDLRRRAANLLSTHP